MGYEDDQDLIVESAAEIARLKRELKEARAPSKKKKTRRDIALIEWPKDGGPQLIGRISDPKLVKAVAAAIRVRDKAEREG